MNDKTKLSLFFKNIQDSIKKKFLFFKMYFAKYILFLFLGFLLGNLFGSLLNIFRELLIWDGFIIILLLIIEEIISYLSYHSTKRIPFFSFHSFILLKKNLGNFFDWYSNNEKNKSSKQKKMYFLTQKLKFHFFYQKIKNYFFNKKIVLIKSLNLFKIGILLGFFVDAFKVGS